MENSMRHFPPGVMLFVPIRLLVVAWLERREMLDFIEVNWPEGK